jgi:uncharacterized protein (DUF2141 family)
MNQAAERLRMKARTILLKSLLVLLLQAWPSGQAVSQDVHSDCGAVVVEALGVNAQRGGVLVVALYRGAEGWLKLEKAVETMTQPVQPDSMTVTFHGLPYGPYAVQLLHDENENGKLDFRWFPFPKPKEGVGVSNNNHRRGKPSYEKAEFIVDKPSVVVQIELRY